ncbi:unnamed protein product, partial [Amoebophrya sp. A120]|eukprot:GSA120T00011808001.1
MPIPAVRSMLQILGQFDNGEMLKKLLSSLQPAEAIALIGLEFLEEFFKAAFCTGHYPKESLAALFAAAPKQSREIACKEGVLLCAVHHRRQDLVILLTRNKMFCPGCAVDISADAKEWNGKTGTVLSYNPEKDRFLVQVESEADEDFLYVNESELSFTDNKGTEPVCLMGKPGTADAQHVRIVSHAGRGASRSADKGICVVRLRVASFKPEKLDYNYARSAFFSRGAEVFVSG